MLLDRVGTPADGISGKKKLHSQLNHQASGDDAEKCMHSCHLKMSGPAPKRHQSTAM